VASILSRIDPATQADPEAIYTVEEHRPKGFVVAQLFAEGRGRFTLLTWVVFFMSLLDLYFLTRAHHRRNGGEPANASPAGRDRGTAASSTGS